MPQLWWNVFYYWALLYFFVGFLRSFIFNTSEYAYLNLVSPAPHASLLTFSLVLGLKEKCSSTVSCWFAREIQHHLNVLKPALRSDDDEGEILRITMNLDVLQLTQVRTYWARLSVAISKRHKFPRDFRMRTYKLMPKSRQIWCTTTFVYPNATVQK